jgi:hypothetical protein
MPLRTNHLRLVDEQYNHGKSDFSWVSSDTCDISHIRMFWFFRGGINDRSSEIHMSNTVYAYILVISSCWRCRWLRSPENGRNALFFSTGRERKRIYHDCAVMTTAKTAKTSADEKKTLGRDLARRTNHRVPCWPQTRAADTFI